MFIVIYEDGVFIAKGGMEAAFSLPGKYFVFSIGQSHQLNQDDGINYLDNNHENAKFRIKHFELIDIKKNTFSNNDKYIFSIYNHENGHVKKIESKTNVLEYALSGIIKIIISASRFPDWESYENANKVDDYKSEIKKLKEEIDDLKKQIIDFRK